MAALPTPLLAVTGSVKDPAKVGVPESVAVPLPVLTKASAQGMLPATVNVGAGGAIPLEAVMARL